ncbi:S41 family peptidase [Candidatus Parcubacteria bacterium]|nr:S41 family peptidase [Candidatus Parcubacteria bacterium]
MLFLKSGIKKSIILFLLIIAVLIGFGFGYYFGEIEGKRMVSPSDELDFSLFWEVYNTLQEKYVEPENFDSQKMIYGAISGMVESLGDPYTVFFDPEEAKIFEEDVKGVFEGVGMEIGLRSGQLTVIAPLEETPAQKAGLRAGDKIMKIDETLTVDISIDEAVKLIRGPKGTEVSLTIYREDWEETKEIKIIRGVIEIPSLDWELLVSPGEAGGLEDNIAYIKLYQFSEKASYDFKSAAQDILNSPAEKIILDLRNNPGGYLGVAQNIAGWFLEKGQIVAIEDFGGDKEQEFYKAKGPEKFLSYPVVVLINQGSASGSEILAGALRDNRGVRLVGEKSFGKGTVQVLEELREGSLKVTIANWLTPNGEVLSNEGLEPDIKIEMTREDYEKEKDPQLEKAIEILREM